MTAIRYSGNVTIRVSYFDNDRSTYLDGTPRNPNGFYRCSLARTVNPGTQWESTALRAVTVGAPNFLSHAVDCSEAFDDSARAALAFANDDDSSWGEAAAYDLIGSDYHVGRSSKMAWPAMAAYEKVTR